MAFPTPPVPPTPPTPQEIVASAMQQITNVMSAVTNDFAPVSPAIDAANASIRDLGDNFIKGLTNNLSSIKNAIEDAKKNLQNDAHVALDKVHDLLTNLPNPGDAIKKWGEFFAKITINGTDIETNPEVLYSTMRELLGNYPKITNSPITIHLAGPAFAPLYPIFNVPTKDNLHALHASLRTVVLPAFQLPTDSRVLNSDPVTITALIILAIIILGLPLSMAMGIAIAAIFLALAAVLIIAAYQGRDITTNVCPEVDITGMTPLDAAKAQIATKMCTTINISGPKR